MIDDAMKRDIKRHLWAVGIDAAVVDELVMERKTLRDEFAMASIPGVLSVSAPAGFYDSRQVADDAYRMADAMLARRSK
jgi:hypothetical protein